MSEVWPHGTSFRVDKIPHQLYNLLTKWPCATVLMTNTFVSLLLQKMHSFIEPEWYPNRVGSGLVGKYQARLKRLVRVKWYPNRVGSGLAGKCQDRLKRLARVKPSLTGASSINKTVWSHWPMVAILQKNIHCWWTSQVSWQAFSAWPDICV